MIASQRLELAIEAALLRDSVHLNHIVKLAAQILLSSMVALVQVIASDTRFRCSDRPSIFAAHK